MRDDRAYFLDANILMYAAGSEHPLREPCRLALARMLDDGVELVTDAEVLQEILYRYFMIGRPETARVLHDATIRICDRVLAIDERHTSRALELLLEHSRLSPRDAIHVAAMEAGGLELLLSTDGDFDGLSQIERIDPGTFVL